MALSIFGEKAVIPNDELLTEALLDRKAIWDSITEHIENTYSKVNSEWKFYSKAAGWSFVVKSGKRTLIYLIPQENCIKVNFVFGERAVAEVQKSDLPQSLITVLLESKPYVEGRSVMLDIAELDEVEIVKKLLKIKNEN